MYGQALAFSLRKERPRAEVTLLAPSEDLAALLERARPHGVRGYYGVRGYQDRRGERHLQPFILGDGVTGYAAIGVPC